jgi:hypothetical protein
VSSTGRPERTKLGAIVVADLLDDVEPVDLLREGGEPLGRQRPREPELERGRLGEGLADVLVDGAGAHDADRRVTQLLAREVARLGELDEGGRAPVDDLSPGLGVGGHHDPLPRVLDIGPRLGHALLARLGHALGVGDAHARADHGDGVELLGDLEGATGEVDGLLARRRLEHGHAGEGGIVPRILLVLRRVHAGVVGRDHDEAGVDAGVGGRHEGVGGHVDADVLGREEGAPPRHGDADGGLEGHLLVGGPFRVGSGQLAEALEDLGRGGAGVADAYGDACLPRPLGDGLVS